MTTTLKKQTLKKLILDICSQTAFSCGDVIYEQIDGVSMGAYLGPVLANIIMTELELVVVDKMVNSGLIKFYGRYVDDTLLLVKPENVDNIMKAFNKFHKNLEFTVDKFTNCVPHFLDLEIHRESISIFRKETHTAQYVNYDSHTKWNHKVAWIRSLVTRAKKLCSPGNIKKEIANIKRFASYNGFPKWMGNKEVERYQHQQPQKEKKENDEDSTTLFMFLPYIGKESEYIVKRCKRKLFRMFENKKKVIFNVQFRTTRLPFFASNKDKIPFLSNSHVVYEYTCPGCSQN